MHKKILFSSLVGNILEWYDLTLYGFFALIFAKLFFPDQNEVISLLAAFGTFAIGFLTRPFGAFIFSHYGDKHGRKKAFSLSLILMGIPTILIGLLPTYSAIGILAPIFLMLLRLLQGLSCGGEFIASIIFLGEHANRDKLGFYSSLSWVGSLSGTFLASVSAMLMTHFMAPHVLSLWGWRVLFILGGAVSFMGMYLRHKASEPVLFAKNKIRGTLPKRPIFEAISHHKKSLMLFFVANIAIAVLSYMFIIYMPTYLTKVIGIASSTALLINAIFILALIFCIPFFGKLCDRVGWKPIMLIATLSLIFAAPLIYWMLNQKKFGFLFVAQGIMLLCTAAIMGGIPSMLIKTTSQHLRFTICAIPYNTTLALFGGTTPLVATYLIHKTSSMMSPAFYLSICSLISFVAIRKIYNAK